MGFGLPVLPDAGFLRIIQKDGLDPLQSRLAQYDFEGATLVATEQKSCECILQIALRLFAGVALRMDIEQIARGNEPLPLFPYLRGELEFH